ncbi:MAG TPA: hypothetical protein VLV86_00300, partial [Vicinamibacterales bacterium]|nr:hypothetical protein [Vicinamibacterales bacterium]
LKLFLNTKALAALSLRTKAEVARRSRDQLTFELLHNTVVEITRLSIEVKNLTMRVESMQSRLEFNERRARALESVVAYTPSEAQPFEGKAGGPSQQDMRSAAEPRSRSDAPAPTDQVQATGAAAIPAGDGQGHRRRRRRRRGRRGGGAPGVGIPPSGGTPPQEPLSGVNDTVAPHEEPADVSDAPDDHDAGSGTDFDPQ